jgi:hypothetical protein
MTDALELFRSMRPDPPTPTEDIQQSPASVRSRGLHDLAMTPGTPGYSARIPKPPCYQCGEDHFSGRPYDHSWMSEPAPIHDEPVSATAIIRRPEQTVVEVTQVRRVALYVGRGETYVVAVEEPPDWDSKWSFKVAPERVLPLILLARALGVKVADKTGGDLVMLEQEEHAREYEKAHAGGAAAAGGAEPRRPRPDADRPEEDQPAPAERANGGVSGGGGERRRPAR